MQNRLIVLFPADAVWLKSVRNGAVNSNGWVALKSA